MSSGYSHDLGNPRGCVETSFFFPMSFFVRWTSSDQLGFADRWTRFEVGIFVPTGEDEARSLAGSLSGFYQQPGESNHLKRDGISTWWAHDGTKNWPASCGFIGAPFFLWAVGRRPFNPLTFPARGQESITELAAAMCLDMECLGLFHPDGFVGIKWINRWFQGLIGSELGRKPNGLITLALLEHRVSHGSKFIHSGG